MSQIRVRAAGTEPFPPPPASVGEADICALVHAFYARIRRDDLLGPIFTREIADDDWPRHLDNMCDFWSSAVLRTDRYGGRPLPPHLRLPELQREHFARWLNLFGSVAEETLAQDAAAYFVHLATRIAHSFQLAIAFHRGEDTTGLATIRPDR